MTPTHPTSSPAPRNRLAGETSPYLLQHAANPVDWYPWGPEALALAAATDRPILLSIGYAACHWCHVMAHESFENPAIATEMNRLFVNIKVDREERPDIDQIYMAALHATGQQGGWPLTMFLTPNGEPFWGGTYFPPESRWGRPGFPEILASIARTYAEAPDRVASAQAALSARLSRSRTETAVLDRSILDAASARLASIIDPIHGGTQGAPKFPQCSLLQLLWRAGVRNDDTATRNLVLTTLRRISEGGIYDHLGGGFSRYSVDDRWLVPHFEKMLYDNAQLIDLLGRAHAATGEPLFLQRIEETVGWLVREMLLPEGAFAASLDADSEGEEGRFYVWTTAEITEVLGSAADAFSAAYDVTPAGNWEHKTILNRLVGLDDGEPVAPAAFAPERAALLARRSHRVRPGLDDKILADWNGLMIAALARVATQFDRPDWRKLATDAYAFVATKMARGDRLGHSYRGGKLVFPGFASDYAATIAAALALHETTGEPAFLDDARRWTAALDAAHWDPISGGYFAAGADAEALILRMKATADEATPSANGQMAENLVRLWILTGDDSYRARVDALFTALAAESLGNLYASASLLAAFDTRLKPIQAVVIVPDGSDPAPMIRAIAEAADARIICSLVGSDDGLPADHPAHGKTAINGKPTIYVCRGTTCSRPVTDAIDVKQLL